MAQKEVFFHVGLSKTASTFLQKRVFPQFKGIEYIHRNPRYQRANKIITKSKADKFLVSREFDFQFESEMKKFAAHHPDTTIIIVFREQHGWLASQYRRFVKNGFTVPFKDFLDLKDDQGVIKKSTLNFRSYLQIIEENFTKKPLVLFYEDLRKDPIGFIDYLAKQVGATYAPKQIKLKKKHGSYNDKQLKAVMAVGKKIDIRKDNTKYPFIYPLVRFYTNTIRYNTLYIAKILPDSWFSKDPLFPPDELEKVRKYYEEDWEAVKRYARENNPPR